MSSVFDFLHKGKLFKIKKKPPREYKLSFYFWESNGILKNLFCSDFKKWNKKFSLENFTTLKIGLYGSGVADFLDVKFGETGTSGGR